MEPFQPGAVFADREKGVRTAASPLDAFEPLGSGPSAEAGDAQLPPFSTESTVITRSELRVPDIIGSHFAILPVPPAQAGPPDTAQLLGADAEFPFLPGGPQPGVLRDAPDAWRVVPASERYPMRFEVDYAEQLSRAKTLFRIVLLLPAYFFLSLAVYVFYAAIVAGWTTVFWRKKYPSWLFAAASGYLGYSGRAFAYFALLTDKFPSLDQDENPVQLEYDFPKQGRLSRWRVLVWKLVLILPHLFVLSFLLLGVYVVVILAWFAILFTGRYPRGMFAFVVGVMRWHFRVFGYVASFNDRFPPYALSAEAGPATTGATVASGVIGFFAGTGIAVLMTVATVVASRPRTDDVDYAQLQQGRDTSVVTYANTADEFVTFRLLRVYDPGDKQAPTVKPGRGERVVVFEWSVDNEQPRDFEFGTSLAKLKATSNETAKNYPARILLVNGEKAPELIEAKTAGGIILAVFVIPADAHVDSLRIKPPFAGTGGLEYRFR